jgi:hypothetical protein
MSHGVLVQPSFLGSDNSYLLQAIARAPQRLRGIAMIDAQCEDTQLQALHQGAWSGCVSTWSAARRCPISGRVARHAHPRCRPGLAGRDPSRGR